MIPLSAFVCLALLLPLAVDAQTPAEGDDKAPQTANSTTGIPTFYAHARQVIVEAEVWNHADKKSAGDASWIPEGALTGAPDGGARLKKVLNLMPPPARGLTPGDFHVLDNGVEQKINYFSEADFPAVGTTTGFWRLDPTTRGMWGTLLFGSGMPHAPSATYLIGYVPPAPQPGDCHTIQVSVEAHPVWVNRREYCTMKNSDPATAPLEIKLRARMQEFASSSAPGAIKVSASALAFWSSGVLSLARRVPPAEVAPVTPATDFTYAVEVHDSKAPTTVQIATQFTLPYLLWNAPCPKNAAIYVLGMVFRANGELETQFGDIFRCDKWTSNPAEEAIKKFYVKAGVPSLFDTQIGLRPGEYEMRLVVSDGKNFGRAQVPLRVQSLDAEALTVSDVVLNSIIRDASWIIRDAAKVAPDPVIPTPLISKKVQFVPVPAHPPKDGPLSVYFEIYEPLADTDKVDVSYSLKITDLKTGSLVMNTGAMSAADWVVPGNVVIPIGLKVAIEKLPPGSYRLEIRASDSAGRQSEWRQTSFAIK